MPFGRQRVGFNNPPASLIGFQQILNRSGFFLYSGPPAFGNLIGSVASVAGTDKFGNSYLSGQTTYTQSGGTFLAANLDDPALSALIGLFVYTAASAAGPWTRQGYVYSDLAGDLVLNSGGGAQPASVTLTNNGLVKVGNASHLLATVVSAFNGAVEETWHPVQGGVGFQNSWADSGAANAVTTQYRLNALNETEIVGDLTVPVAGPNAIIFTLPAGYRPAHIQQIPFVIVSQAGGAPQVTTMRAFVGSSGDVTAANFPAGLTSMRVAFPADTSISLDA